MDRRRFLMAGIGLLPVVSGWSALSQWALTACTRTRKIPLLSLSGRELVSSLRDGRVRLEELAEAVYMAAEEAQKGFRPFIGLNRESVRAEFRRLESSPKDLPLFGLPLAVKDNLQVKGWPRSVGVNLPGKLAPQDSWAVARLRKSGAVPFARTNLTEFAWGVITESGQVGYTVNPLLPGHVSGGSSGGSAAAVAAGVCAAALATDTSGSIRIPAALCGLWGFRPSRERVDLSGLFRISRTRDSVGPICRRADDLAFVSERLLGTRPLRKLTEMSGLRFAFDESMLEECHSAVVEALNDFEDALKKRKIATKHVSLRNYVEVVRWARDDSFVDGYSSLSSQVREEFGSSLEELLPVLVPRTRNALTFAKKNARERQGLTQRDVEGRRRNIAARILEEAFPENQILVLPTTLQPPFRQEELASIAPTKIFEAYTKPNVLAPCLKAPALSIPIARNGRSKGTGVTLMARPGQDELLLELALYIESQLGEILPEAPSKA